MMLYLDEYAYFTDKQELEETVKRHLAKHGKNLTVSDRTVLHTFRFHSHNGATHMTHEKIGQAIGKSNSTVRRAIRKLEQHGIVERIHFIQPVMNGLGGNIYTILPSVNEPNRYE